ncbi:vascular endothelial growth factor C-like [Saccoglossus kowalevskii]
MSVTLRLSLISVEGINNGLQRNHNDTKEASYEMDALDKMKGVTSVQDMYMRFYPNSWRHVMMEKFGIGDYAITHHNKRQHQKKGWMSDASRDDLIKAADTEFKLSRCAPSPFVVKTEDIIRSTELCPSTTPPNFPRNGLITFFPPCLQLFRCSGCCHGDCTSHCKPTVDGQQIIEKVVFLPPDNPSYSNITLHVYNYTECECNDTPRSVAEDRKEITSFTLTSQTPPFIAISPKECRKRVKQCKTNSFGRVERCTCMCKLQNHGCNTNCNKCRRHVMRTQQQSDDPPALVIIGIDASNRN